jgi:two-component system secretion response regulator SsrB
VGSLMKIIIIEDNELLRKFILEMLNRHFPNHDILSFTTGEDAIEEIPKAPVHIAVLDIHLPGINGLQIIHLLRKEWPDAFIIVYTNYDFREYRDGAIEFGANYFLSKEKNKPEELIQLIDSATI